MYSLLRKVVEFTALAALLAGSAEAAFTPANPNGQATSANSAPVVVASDQAGVPVMNNIAVASSSNGYTRPANTTAYAAGQLVANSVTAGSVTPATISVARANSTGGVISQVQLVTSSTVLTNAIFRIHFYNIAPTFTNGDGAAWLTPVAGYIGYVDITASQAFSSGAAGLGVPAVGSGLAFTPVSGAQTLYWVIEARAAYTPTSGETFSLNVWTN